MRRVEIIFTRVAVIIRRAKCIATRRKICVASLIMMQHGWQLKYGAVWSLLGVSE